jgi:hypothetical protein
VKLAKKTGVELRQSYERVGKRALIAHQRYAHAKQFKRANRALKTIRTYLGRVVRDILRKIRGEAELESVFARPLMLARRVRAQRQHQRGRKVYSLHAPEVECIGKGRAHRPYELMAWTTPASRGTIAARAGRQEDIPCLRRPSSPSASTWARIAFTSSASTVAARSC